MRSRDTDCATCATRARAHWEINFLCIFLPLPSVLYWPLSPFSPPFSPPRPSPIFGPLFSPMWVNPPPKFSKRRERQRPPPPPSPHLAVSHFNWETTIQWKNREGVITDSLCENSLYFVYSLYSCIYLYKYIYMYMCVCVCNSLFVLYTAFSAFTPLAPSLSLCILL